MTLILMDFVTESYVALVRIFWIYEKFINIAAIPKLFKKSKTQVRPIYYIR